jgi:threonine dehydratase
MILEEVDFRLLIEGARKRIEPYAHNTPVFTSQYLNKKSGAKIFFKCENFQKVGAFKFRGACNAVMGLDDKAAEKGVATHSSGNHAQALALAAKMRNIPAYIVMPRNAPAVKKAAVLGYGAEVIECNPTLKDREETLEKVVERTNAHVVHPYNDERIISGQATTALELIKEVEDLDCLIAPVGGGGLLSGTALSANLFGRNIKVFGAEPEGASDAHKSFNEGHIVPSIQPNTIADGLLTSLGDKTFPIIESLVTDILLVNDDEIRSSMHLIWERMKIIVEPSAAVPLAAVLKNQHIFKNLKTGVILSGGNLDLKQWKF